MTTIRITSRQQKRRHVAKTVGTYTLDSTYDIVLCNCADGAITLNLPTAANSDGWSYTIIKTDSSTNAVTVVGTINGSANLTIGAQNSAASMACDASGWWIV